MTHEHHHTSRRGGGYQPPHCPNPACTFHRPEPHWHFVRDGFYRPASHKRPLQVYQCLSCNRRFTAKTFSATYWLRYPRLLARVAHLITEGSGFRQAGRVLKISHTTVRHYAARLGRHSMLFQAQTIAPLDLKEEVVVDGFESFAYSQYFPMHLNLAVGAHSWFLYYFTDSPLRRKGAMTAEQKVRRAELEKRLGRPDPKAVELGIMGLLQMILKHLPSMQLVLHTDDHPAYRRAVRRICEETVALRIDHGITSSTLRRTRSNPLFPVNLADQLLRHSSANHRRETIAFSKTRQSVIERLAIFTVWRNYVKKRRENGRRQSTAMWLGLINRLLTWKEVLGQRIFPAHVDLPPEWIGYYWSRVKTAAYEEREAEHTCRYAF